MRSVLAIMIALTVPGIAGALAQSGTPPLLIPAPPAPPPPPLFRPPPVPSAVTPLPSPSYGIPPGVTRSTPLGSGGHGPLGLSRIGSSQAQEIPTETAASKLVQISGCPRKRDND